MKILFVGMAESVHLARWIDQLSGAGWDLHMFPSVWPVAPHADLCGVTLHGVGLFRPAGLQESVTVPMPAWLPRGSYNLDRWIRRHAPGVLGPVRELRRTIQRVKPDILHVLEMQHAGYLAMQALRGCVQSRRPPLVYSCWGSDIYHFRHEAEHESRIRRFLAMCDFMMADCNRDHALAREYGFRGVALGCFPGPGGFDLAAMQPLRQGTAPDQRKTIAVRGNHQWVGRALCALQAVHRCADVLTGYEIVVYAPTDNVKAVVSHMRAVTALNINMLPTSKHSDILRLFGRARAAIAVSVSDGTPNTMLEAMAMGACPVQSDTGSTAEWIDNGENGLLVPPNDVDAIEAAIRRVVSDDALVLRADRMNAARLMARIDRSVVLPRVLAAYGRVRGGSV